MADWVLIPVAGESRRFNGIKALAPWKDGTMLSQAIETARLTNSNVMVVTGAHHNEIVPLLSDVSFIYNSNWQDGMGQSLATGVKAILEQDTSVSLITILPVDQPFVTCRHLMALMAMATQHERCVFTRAAETMGPPAAVPKTFFKDILQLDGEQGLKSVLRAHQYQTIENPAALHDIDTQADWLKYNHQTTL